MCCASPPRSNNSFMGKRSLPFANRYLTSSVAEKHGYDKRCFALAQHDMLYPVILNESEASLAHLFDYAERDMRCSWRLKRADMFQVDGS
jgi:hypothetical protein